MPPNKEKASRSTPNGTKCDEENSPGSLGDDVIEIKDIIPQIISCSSSEDELIIINTSQSKPKLALKYFDLTEIMPNITDHEHIALTGKSLRKRKLSSTLSNNQINTNGINNRHIKKKANNKKKKQSSKEIKDTSSNYSIYKYFMPSLKSSSMSSGGSKLSELKSLSIKSCQENGSNEKVGAYTTQTVTTTTPPPPQPLPVASTSEIICLDDLTIKDEGRKNSQLLPPTKMISIPLCNLTMLNEVVTYKIVGPTKSIDNHEIRLNKSSAQTRKPHITVICENEKKLTDQIATNSHSCDVTTFSLGEHRLTMPGNNLVSLNCLENNNSTKIDEITSKKSSTSSQKCPAYKIIDGTTFAVDGFRFGSIPGVTDYFLTHFHADHYIGLRKSFSYPLWTSKITARLVNHFIKVDEKYIRVLEIGDKPIRVNGVDIFTLEANHCPGAVMFLFKLPDGRNILHTGDFRASAEMESYPCFWSYNIDIIYLDTTYLKKSYNFMSQMDSIDIVKYEVNKFLTANIGKKYLIIVGSYIIGKEKVWKAIAQYTNQKVWLDEKQSKASKIIFPSNTHQHVLNMIVERKDDAAIHVLPMKKLSYQFLVEYLKDFDDHVMLAVRVSGWEKHTRNNYGSRISIIGVEYSEHSSYGELERFVRYLKPKKVISTVPVSGNNLHICPRVPDDWISCNDPKPMKHSYQRNITSYFKQN